MELGSAIPSILWDAFEEALQTNMLRLAKDIATSLGKPHHPLMEAIKKQKVRPYLVDSANEEIDITCDYICQRPDTPALLQPCAQAILWGFKRCPQHMYLEKAPPSQLPVAKTVEIDEETLYVEEDILYDGEYEAKGRIGNKKVFLFEVKN
jgi:hypothetical protein